VFTGQASATAYGAILTLTMTTWLLAGFAREKMCTYMCPWPRLQGAVWDPEALVVTYRDYRGEERMSAKKAAAARSAGRPAGDCVDCMACVHVCPMGIDIRNGPSIACINCGLCVDACDTTMGKLGRERGLIDYESWTNIERGRANQSREPVRLLRLKVIALSAALLVIVAGIALSVSARGALHLGVSHDRNPIAVMLSDGRVRNAYEVRVEALAGTSGDFTLQVTGNAPLRVAVMGGEVSDDGHVPISLGAGLARQLRVTIVGDATLEGDLVFTIIEATSGESTSVTNFFKFP
jgi:cytochrome c oxidase accessory protein FixG